MYCGTLQFSAFPCLSPAQFTLPRILFIRSIQVGLDGSQCHTSQWKSSRMYQGNTLLLSKLTENEISIPKNIRDQDRYSSKTVINLKIQLVLNNCVLQSSSNSPSDVLPPTSIHQIQLSCSAAELLPFPFYSKVVKKRLRDTGNICFHYYRLKGLLSFIPRI